MNLTGKIVSIDTANKEYPLFFEERIIDSNEESVLRACDKFYHKYEGSRIIYFVNNELGITLFKPGTAGRLVGWCI